MAKAGTAETLLGHVRVNAVADYYDIPQLKELANTKIRHIIQTNWSPYGFSEVIKEVFNSTTDKELREIMSLTVAAHIEELLEFEDFTELGVIGDFAIGKADRINHFLKILSKIQSYRNCDADFTCYVERGGTILEPQYTLRCAKCHCRHKYIR